MNIKLYVANLAPATTYHELMNLFSAHGNVTDIDLLDDPTKGRPRGFGFVTMATSEGAQAAIEALHRKEIGTHVLTVSKMQADELRAGLASGGRSPVAPTVAYTSFACEPAAETIFKQVDFILELSKKRTILNLVTAPEKMRSFFGNEFKVRNVRNKSFPAYARD
jgi:cold-inducible RNA-binding protein